MKKTEIHAAALVLQNGEDIRMIETLIHTPIDFLIALLSLAAVVFIVDRLGFLAWVAWVNRHQDERHNRHRGKPKGTASGEYWRVHL